mgnify:CR=1 FL=1
MEIVDELNREFFGQEFACSDQTSRSEVLEHYKRLAGVYARMENAISVLSDMHAAAISVTEAFRRCWVSMRTPG